MSQKSPSHRMSTESANSMVDLKLNKEEIGYNEILTEPLMVDQLSPDDFDVMEQVAPLGEMSNEAKKRLEGIDSWRCMNEEPYSPSRKQNRKSRVDFTDKLAPVLERHVFDSPLSAVESEQLDEASFIIKHFDDARCYDFKPAKHQQTYLETGAVCSICGLTEDFHKGEDELEGICDIIMNNPADVTQRRSRFIKNDRRSSEGRPLLRIELPRPGMIRPISEATRIPAMAFGSIVIPHRFLGRVRVNSLGSSYKGQFTRKYMRCASANSSSKLPMMWELLTRVWNVTPPTLVISVTGGSVKSMEPNVRSCLSEALNRLVSRTETWIISDGRNYGASRFLGQMLSEGNDLTTSKGQGKTNCVPVLIGVSHWGSLRRKALLMSISSPPETRSSRYFYSMEYKLSREEHSRILNPYQSAYLLLDNGKRAPDDCVQSFRADLDQYLSSKNVSQIDGYSTSSFILKTTLPVLTLVLGGDGERTIDQVLHALQSNYPVIIIKGSSSVPTLLAELFYALEDKVPRSGRTWDDQTSKWDEREDRVFKSYITKLRDKIQSIFYMKHSDSDEAVTNPPINEKHFDKILSKLEEIMRCRFYITVIDCELETSENLSYSILRGMYKGYSRASGLTIALKTCQPEFLQALFDRSDEPSQQKSTKNFITVSSLNDLHRENLCKTSSLTKVLKMVCKRASYDTRKSNRNFLPLVGRILHLLMGPRYKLMYHDQHFLDLKDNVAFQRKRWQVWHLFIWSVLSGKPGMTQFFVAQSAAPLGAALIAFQLYSGLAQWATMGYEEELNSFLKDCANQFQQLAINLLDSMYESDAEGAYQVLISELPFDLGPYITPFVIADDARAMDFMSQGGCQTYLQRVWKGNMVVETPNWRSFPIFFFIPCLSVPWIHFYDSSLTSKVVLTNKVTTPKKTLPTEGGKFANPMIEPDLNTSMTSLSGVSRETPTNTFYLESRRSSSDHDYGSCFDHLIFFWTAPITKFYSGMISYMCFLALLSYFVLSDLKPFESLEKIGATEWILIIWNISLILEESVQVFGINDTGPLYGVNGNGLKSSVWHTTEIFQIRMFPVVMYLRNERWNAIDVTIHCLFIVSYVLRYSLPVEMFQMCRFMFAVTVIFSYFRLLRFWFVLQSIGPRVIAMQMMLNELTKFLSVLIVFILGFGVAFQAILNPNQPVSMMTVVDVFYRTFWQMFGELFLDDTVGMGRTVSEQSCQAMSSSMNETNFYCLSWAAPVMLGVYLLIANVLLLNLLIATFSQAYEDVKSKAHAVYLYNLYSLIQECYYQTAMPPPLSLIQRFCSCVLTLVTICRQPKKPINVVIEDCFRTKASQYVSRLQKKACENFKLFGSRTD